jgi:hypothetical protein
MEAWPIARLIIASGEVPIIKTSMKKLGMA